MKSRRLHHSLRIIWLLVLLFLYAPLFIVVLFSFNEANSAASFTQFSLKWYYRLFSDDVILHAVKNSLILAVVSSIIATALGTMLGYGMYKYRERKLSWLIWLIYLPMVMPDVIYGIAQMGFFTQMSQTFGILHPGLTTMIIAHVSFQIPFVALVIYARLVGMDPRLFDASQDLYANAVQRAAYFIVPSLKPALLAGFFLAFTLSIDDFVISFFTSGPASTTLPIYIWSAIKKGVSPEINAIASLIIVSVFVFAIVLLMFQSARDANHQATPGKPT